MGEDSDDEDVSFVEQMMEELEDYQEETLQESE